MKSYEPIVQADKKRKSRNFRISRKKTLGKTRPTSIVNGEGDDELVNVEDENAEAGSQQEDDGFTVEELRSRNDDLVAELTRMTEMFESYLSVVKMK